MYRKWRIQMAMIVNLKHQHFTFLLGFWMNTFPKIIFYLHNIIDIKKYKHNTKIINKKVLPYF